MRYDYTLKRGYHTLSARSAKIDAVDVFKGLLVDINPKGNFRWIQADDIVGGLRVVKECRDDDTHEDILYRSGDGALERRILRYALWLIANYQVVCKSRFPASYGSPTATQYSQQMTQLAALRTGWRQPAATILKRSKVTEVSLTLALTFGIQPHLVEERFEAVVRKIVEAQFEPELLTSLK